MAYTTITTYTVDGNNAVRPKIRISTATLPGLIQTYAMAEELLPNFAANPDLLKAAMDDPARRDRATFFLQQAAKAVNALQCLEDGDGDALDYARTLITGMVCAMYQQAEKA
jgi:hypothetical protein